MKDKWNSLREETRRGLTFLGIAWSMGFLMNAIFYKMRQRNKAKEGKGEYEESEKKEGKEEEIQT